MQRVRVGLIGLAWVFLLVMLATTFVHIAGGDRTGSGSAGQTNTAAPSEPLAELGVAPGNPASDNAAQTPPAKPRAPAR